MQSKSRDNNGGRRSLAHAAPGTTRAARAIAPNDPITAIINGLVALVDNKSPTLRPSQTGQGAAGQVTGRLGADDPDSAVLTFSVIGNPDHGTVAIAPDGTYTYTPDPGMARTGTVDSFQVSASDESGDLHVHGLLGLLNVLTFGLLGRNDHTVTATVAVTVAAFGPPNNAPTGSVTVGDPDQVTGLVTGRVLGSDADGDAITYRAPSTTAKGLVTISAAGDFTYTPTTAARQNSAAADAPAADKSDTFNVTLTDAFGGSTPVGVVVAVAPAEQPGIAADELRATDLSFAGFFRVPTGQLEPGDYATLAYGGTAMASRVVGGERHFFFTGHRYANDPLIELVAPEGLAATVDTAPVAELYRYWGDIYGGTKVTSEEPDGTAANANWTEGLLWDEAGQRLLWSYGNWYAADHVNNPVLGLTELHADGSVTVQGPWRTTADSQQTRSFAVFLSPAVSAASGGATIGLGAKLQSINGSASWGPSLFAIAAPAEADGPIVAEALISHPITPIEQRTTRQPDYEVARNPDGSPDSAGTQPPVAGIGYWTELDETTGATFVQTASGDRSALVYAGGQASGLIWYGPDLEHGVADGRGYNGSGNHAESYRPVLYFVSESDLISSAEGALAPQDVNPYLIVDLVDRFPALASLSGLSAGQPYFAADEGRLYVPFTGTAEGGPYPVIAVFAVGD